MTRVVVQRGGSSNQPQSRPSNSASASASSSTTTPSNTQPPAGSSSSLGNGEDISDILVSEADFSKGESYATVVGGSGKAALVDSRATNEIEPVVGRAQCSLIGREQTLGQNEENMAKQLQHTLVSENKLDTTELNQSGTDSSSGIPTVNVDGEGQVKSVDAVRKDRSSEELPRPSESSSRSLSGRSTSSTSSGSSAGQKAPPANLSHLSPSSMPLPVPTSHPPGVQPVSHVPPVLALSVHPQVAVSGDTLPVSRTYEENDPGRSPSSSDSVGCSNAAAPIPQAPPAPSTPASSRRSGWVGCSAINSNRGPSSRRFSVSLKARSSPNSSRPTSPRSYGEGDGYNSADEHNPWTPGPSGYKDGAERERQFEMELRRVKGLEVRHMLEDGNCLFRAVTHLVYGDAEMYDETRQMCIDYMEKERDHFSQFVTESFTAYCKRKRRDKVYGNNLEIQAMAEIYNRPIHIYSYSTEPINIFQGSYETDLPPIRLSYHRGNHYNAIIDPCNPAVGAGLGFGSLRGRNVNTEQVKAALNAQQEQQIDKAILAEGRYYSDMELTEQEIERMVMEASRAEYLAGESRRALNSWQEETSTSAGAEPSSSRTTGRSRNTSELMDSILASNVQPVSLPSAPSEDSEISESVRMLLFMGFSYLRVMEAYSIFGDNINNMLCYLLETEAPGSGTGENIRRKGKAAE
ncbi:hypothetical protein M758_3G238300 [Ceratodon purpureus]|nr:hypothetical protein M758_3G238300 [Ceratodon purpureus]